MKKFMVWCLTIVMMFTLCVSSFAAPGAFVQSPSRNDGPTLEEGTNESEDCTAQLVVTPYRDRDELPEKAYNDIVTAYDIIKNCTDVTTLCSAFATAMEARGLNGVNLAVSDLFDVSYYNCGTHEQHGAFRIKLNANTLRNFVGLLHYNDGVWEYVENAHVLADGETLEFSIDDLSPFAVVVEKEAEGVASPDTGDYLTYILPIIILVCSAALVVVCIKIKKREA